MDDDFCRWLLPLLFAFFCVASRAEEPRLRSTKIGDERPAQVPLSWDEKELSTLELPLADPHVAHRDVPASYYYRIPVRPIYQSYPIYDPRSGKEPPGYLESLKNKKPVRVSDEAHGIWPRLKTEADWIEAGQIVFDAPISFEDDPPSTIIPSMLVRLPQWYERLGIPTAPDGTMPFARYVVTDKGLVVGNLACAMCHTRVQPDGTVIKGAQGNIPFDRMIAFLLAGAPDKPAVLSLARGNMSVLFETPWIRPDPLERLKSMSLDEQVATRNAIPPGIIARHGTSLWYPVQVPDLIGLESRRLLDRTGLVQHRTIGDLMRYAALNQGGDWLQSMSGFIPGGVNFRDLPEPKDVRFRGRYSDTQLFALAKYLYSLKPPENPNLPRSRTEEELVSRGQAIFTDEGCVGCHRPQGGLYTNNKLTPAHGFTAPALDRRRYSDLIMSISVGTDSGLALRTRRGTGYYKVPSLKGVWYRGPFEHNGSVATLEDWFDPRRLNNDYKPTGFSNRGGKPGPVRGHEFGLDLSDTDRKALIAFLKTL
jgi:hypothetical protein